jgi:hypothetical protein
MPPDWISRTRRAGNGPHVRSRRLPGLLRCAASGRYSPGSPPGFPTTGPSKLRFLEDASSSRLAPDPVYRKFSSVRPGPAALRAHHAARSLHLPLSRSSAALSEPRLDAGPAHPRACLGGSTFADPSRSVPAPCPFLDPGPSLSSQIRSTHTPFSHPRRAAGASSGADQSALGIPIGGAERRSKPNRRRANLLARKSLVSSRSMRSGLIRSSAVAPRP